MKRNTFYRIFISFCLLFMAGISAHAYTERNLLQKAAGSEEQLKEALADIERQGLRLVPLCPFVAGYIHKHPEWKRIVMRGIHIK